ADQRRERKRSEAERRKALQPLKRALERCEAKMERLQARKAQLETELADTGIYTEGRKDELQQILRDKAAVDQQLEDAEGAWLEAAEALEQAQSRTQNTRN
ncbi:MAG: ABC transporter ATP-binding protein, partial [Sedimenticolaceae bacterium]